MSYALDTGPLVALLNESDAHHAWAVEALGRVRPPLVTCEAVLSEACFLLGRARRARRPAWLAPLELVQRGLLTPAFSLHGEIDPVTKLLERYAGVPMSLADACLVRMTELSSSTTVITLDEDFRVYRRNGRSRIAVLAPWS